MTDSKRSRLPKKTIEDRTNEFECWDGNTHNGDRMIAVQRSSIGGYGEDRVTNWCQSCGVSTTDIEVDGRLYKKGKMRLPEYLTKGYGK